MCNTTDEIPLRNATVKEKLSINKAQGHVISIRHKIYISRTDIYTCDYMLQKPLLFSPRVFCFFRSRFWKLCPCFASVPLLLPLPVAVSRAYATSFCNSKFAGPFFFPFPLFLTFLFFFAFVFIFFDVFQNTTNSRPRILLFLQRMILFCLSRASTLSK